MQLYKNKEWLEKEIKNTIYAEHIAKKCGVSGDTIAYWAKKYNLELNPKRFHYRKNDFNTRIFKEIDSEEKAYWLGFLMADGCINSKTSCGRYSKVTILLKSSDIGHLEKFKDFVGCKNKICTKVVSNHKLGIESEISSISVSSVEMVDDLISHKVTPNKTGFEVIPNTVPFELIRHFLRGYFDGDGSFTQGHRISIGSSSLAILKQICDYTLNVIGENFTIYEENYYKVPFWKIDSNHCGRNKNFLTHLYKDSNIYLERKYVKINKFISAPLVDKRKTRKKSSELTGSYLSFEHQIALVTDAMAKCNDFGMVKDSEIGQSAAKLLEEYYNFLQEERSTTIP